MNKWVYIIFIYILLYILYYIYTLYFIYTHNHNSSYLYPFSSWFAWVIAPVFPRQVKAAKGKGCEVFMNSMYHAMDWLPYMLVSLGWWLTCECGEWSCFSWIFMNILCLQPCYLMDIEWYWWIFDERFLTGWFLAVLAVCSGGLSPSSLVTLSWRSNADDTAVMGHEGRQW